MVIDLPMITLDKHTHKAFIFDLDGTMIDNMMVHHRAWQKKLKEMGIHLTIEEVMESIHGINEEIIRRLFGKKYSDEEVRAHAAEKEARYREIYKDSLQLIDGLPELLKAAKNVSIPLSIGSAAPKENVDFVLDTLDIRSDFEVVMHSGDVTRGKPDPEIYLKIMEKLSVSSDQAVIFEDSVVGAKAAENAGCKMIIVTTTHRPAEFDDIKGILGFIQDFKEITLQ